MVECHLMLKFPVGPNRNASFPDTPLLSDHIWSHVELFNLTIYNGPCVGEMYCKANNDLHCKSCSLIRQKCSCRVFLYCLRIYGFMTADHSLHLRRYCFRSRSSEGQNMNISHWHFQWIWLKYFTDKRTVPIGPKTYSTGLQSFLFPCGNNFACEDYLNRSSCVVSF